MMLEIIIAILLFFGSLFVLVAAIGVVRLPDLLMKMHASTKAGTLGAGLTLLSVAFVFGEVSVATRVIAIIFFLLLTAPVAAHVIGRAGYYSGLNLWKGTVVDEFFADHPGRFPSRNSENNNKEK